ncbi:efflux RND transporter periplasmic adaptor subunit [Kineobactrum salinum]|uniref:Efflux RND transporter periplasmic adaptor subunit n=1 Tax=Kineobactrum salinum TaxID=2708301 RepID=A0A6C0TXQ9_9GAMM|nr:efflux RND transporter periplasmic adaptor subunit [Kineobactrum salinum]QIB64581.1 efflux RND transporter periplasmic adaptor subunit [Kineobactrum salinum]
MAYEIIRLPLVRVCHKHVQGGDVPRLKNSRLRWFTVLALVLAGNLLLVPRLLAEGVPVVTARVGERPILRELRLTGTVTAQRRARLSVAVSGLVAELTVEEGDRVEAGALLLQMDPELARIRLATAEAGADQARVRLQDARRRLEEARQLLPQRGIAETAVRDLEAEVEQARSLAAGARAEAELQRALLKRHDLRAPFAGVISAKLTDPGEWLDPGQAVFDLVGLQSLRLDFSVAEDYLTWIEAGTAVEFALGAMPGERYRGTVRSVVPVAEPGARTFLLRVQPDREALQELLPGMSATALLSLETGRSGLTVSRDATLRYPDGRVVVWTVDESEDGLVAREQVVSPGVSFEGLVEIRAGLEAGDRVVVRGNESLRNGQRITLVDSPRQR